MNGFCQAFENQEEYVAGQDQIWQKKGTCSFQIKEDATTESNKLSSAQNLTVLGEVVKLLKVAVASFRYRTSVLSSSALYMLFNCGY